MRHAHVAHKATRPVPHPDVAREGQHSLDVGAAAIRLQDERTSVDDKGYGRRVAIPVVERHVYVDLALENEGDPPCSGVLVDREGCVALACEQRQSFGGDAYALREAERLDRLHHLSI